jgi:hypothetical protein
LSDIVLNWNVIISHQNFVTLFQGQASFKPKCKQVMHNMNCIIKYIIVKQSIQKAQFKAMANTIGALNKTLITTDKTLFLNAKIHMS